MIIILLIACSLNVSDNDVKNIPLYTDDPIEASDLAPYKELPENFFVTGKEPSPSLISLGRSLFNEKSLSASGKISCSTCHNLNKAGADGLRYSNGHNGELTTRNSPTVLNAAGHYLQFWDGRSKSVEEQALGPILAKGEMAMSNPEEVVLVISSNSDYVKMFSDAFPDQTNPITFQNIGIAIGSYERTLVTPSRWDLFLSGDTTALSPEEKSGFKIFSATGCGACHNGELLGGNSLAKAGMYDSWPNQEDLGRYGVSKYESDKMVFKVPSLRNVTLTAPYFHDGSIDDLPTAIKMMAHYQLGKEITDSEAASIELWLGSTAGIIAD